MNRKTGNVYLVGIGPGAPDLITVRGLACLRRADVVAHDRFALPDLLACVRQDARCIDVGKAPGCAPWSQDRINRLLIDEAQRGRCVVRLKGGDPFVFGRGGEEREACRQAGVPCRVVPGVSSALAAPLSVGIPVTHRGLARSFAVITARTGDADAPPDHDYVALARVDTLIVMMGRATLRGWVEALMAAGKDGATPVACIERATTSAQRHVIARLDSIVTAVAAAGLAAPMVTIVGGVVRLAETADPADHPMPEPIAGACRDLMSGSFPEPPAEAHCVSVQGAASYDMPMEVPKAEARASGLRSGMRGSDAPVVMPAPETPLMGRRVVLTHARRRGDRLARDLTRAGATVLACPLIRITYLACASSTDPLRTAMSRADCVAFTSRHGVAGFFRRLHALGSDARALNGKQVAAIGSGTARALRRCGISADVVPARYTAVDLARAILCHDSARRPRHVLCPCGNLARPELRDRLMSAGVDVTRVGVYHTAPADPPADAVVALKSGVDAVVFSSPSAVRQFERVSLPKSAGRCIAIGSTTAAALRETAWVVDAVAETADTKGIVECLNAQLAPRGLSRTR